MSSQGVYSKIIDGEIVYMDNSPKSGGSKVIMIFPEEGINEDEPHTGEEPAPDTTPWDLVIEFRMNAYVIVSERNQTAEQGIRPDPRVDRFISTIISYVQYHIVTPSEYNFREAHRVRLYFRKMKFIGYQLCVAGMDYWSYFRPGKISSDFSELESVYIDYGWSTEIYTTTLIKLPPGVKGLLFNYIITCINTGYCLTLPKDVRHMIGAYLYPRLG